MQTILGSGGAIGKELAKALTNYTSDIRLVSRNPEKINPTDQLLAADLLNPDELDRAIHDSAIVYVTVGFPYSYKVWEKAWPAFVSHLIKACKKQNCKLVFFDNVYMYSKNQLNPMTEETPVRPPSKKGEVRKRVADMILEEINQGGLKALIARSADFYGPSIQQTSILTETVFKPLHQGKKANWFASDSCKHSFTFTPDAGKATALLGNTPHAYGQTWHLPTASNPPTGKLWVEAIASRMGVEPKYRVVAPLIVKVMGWFMPIMKESVEMLYQYDRDYVFDSGKFENTFDLRPTPYEDGIEQIIASDYS
jgi:nucleoside-diphosphate-sugar epimerase